MEPGAIMTISIWQWSRRMKRVVQVVPLVCAILCALIVWGCRKRGVVWSAKAQSPDTQFVATAEAFANDGFGTAGVPATFVYVDWAHGSQHPTEIAVFSAAGSGAEFQSVELRWLSESRLDVVYHKDKQTVDFEAVRWGNVQITLRGVSSMLTSPAR
jgi:hypothetical protein